MRNWLRSRSARPPRRPLLSRPTFHKPYLETLEDRLAPAASYVALAGLLGFYGDFTVESGTTYTSNGADPVQIGQYAGPDGNNFVPVLQVVNGVVSFDIAGSNGDATFTVNGSIETLADHGIPNFTLYSAASDTQFNGKDMVQDGFSLSAPSAPFSAGPFTFQVISIGIKAVTVSDKTIQAVAIQGSMAIDLSDKGQNPNSNGIKASVMDGDYLYVSPELANGFDVSGLSLSVTEDFQFYGVKFQTQGLTVDFGTSEWGDFSVYGNARLTTEAPDNVDPDMESAFELDLSVQFGSQGHAGLTFDNWDVDEFDVKITEDFKLGGFSVQVNDLQVSYNGKAGQDGSFTLGGGLSLNVGAWEASVILGGSTPGASPGIIIDADGEVQFEGVTLNLGNLDLGAFTINYANLTFNSTKDHQGNLDLGLAGAASISVPGGWEAALSIAFEFDNGSFELEEIGFSVQLGSQGLLIGDTDVYITYVSAELDGLGTQNWSVSGTVGVAFGQEITIKGKMVRLVQAIGSFTLDKDKLALDGSVAFGGYTTSDAPTQLNSVLGILDGNIIVDPKNWTTG